MATFCITTPDPEPKPLDIGEQLAADIRRRIRELESRYPGALTSADRRELQRLATMRQRMNYALMLGSGSSRKRSRSPARCGRKMPPG
jgi:hypothetical protein